MSSRILFYCVRFSHMNLTQNMCRKKKSLKGCFHSSARYQRSVCYGQVETLFIQVTRYKITYQSRYCNFDSSMCFSFDLPDLTLLLLNVSFTHINVRKSFHLTRIQYMFTGYTGKISTYFYCVHDYCVANEYL